MSDVSFDFAGKNFVVTGASSGMGKQTVIELAQAGATVLAIARRTEKLEELRAVNPERIFSASADVRSIDAMKTSVEAFVKEHGKLDGGVHAAGITGITALRSYDEELAHAILDISFWGAVNFMQVCSKSEAFEQRCQLRPLFVDCCQRRPQRQICLQCGESCREYGS